MTGKNLTIMNCEVITEDSSDFEIQVSDNLILESSGTSQMYIYGDPKITINEFSESAKLHKKEL